MSDVGMCQRMFLQINYTEMLQKLKRDTIANRSIEEMEEIRETNKMPMLNFQQHSEMWRKCVRDTFGENGKQIFWDCNKSNGKLIGQPQGLGVALMQSNLATYPIVRKKNNSRDFILVRQGKKWFLRRIDNIYTSGQI